MSETRTCPLPTPELVAALANQYIEELNTQNPSHSMERAFQKITGCASEPWDERGALMRLAAAEVARLLSFPKPYETQVTLQDGSTLPPERHTITYFTDGEGFTPADWACISALELGETYIVQGSEAAMTVRRVE